MGSGGTTALLPPDKFFFKYRTLTVLSGADTQSRTGDLTLTKGALYQLSHISTLNLMPGSSLLSHGETPHYHLSSFRVNPECQDFSLQPTGCLCEVIHIRRVDGGAL